MTRGHFWGGEIFTPPFLLLATIALAAGPSVTIVSGGSAHVYTKVTPEAPFTAQASGPSSIVLIFRQRLGPPGVPPTPGTLSITVDGRKVASYAMNFPPEPGASCREEPNFIPSTARSIRLTVPPGDHTYEITMTGLGGAVTARVVSAPTPPAPAKEKKGPPAKVFDVAAALSIGYDSNILQLSPSDLDLFRADRNYTPLNSYIPRIDSAISSTNDFPIIFELVGTAQGRPWEGRKTTAELRGHSFFYPRNIVKWHGDAGIAFIQEFSPGPLTEISYRYQTPTYLRNLSYFDPQAAGTSFSFVTYRKSWFYTHTADISVSQPIKGVLTITAGYQFQAVYYREIFKERNSYVHRGRGGIGVRPVGPLEIVLEGSYERSLALGDIPSTPRIEADTSYAQTSGMGRVRLDLEKLGWAGLLLDIGGGIVFRSFTTNNAQDPLHYRRQDAINSLDGRITYRITSEWAVGASYGYTLVNSNVPALPLEQRDEATSYREDIALLTVIYHSPSFGPPQGRE